MLSTGDVNPEAIVSGIDPKKHALLFLGVDELESDEMRLFYQLRDSHPDLHIVLMPRLSVKGSAVALEGLKMGAIDYVTKPDNSYSLLFADRHFYKRVIPLLKLISLFNNKHTDSNTESRTERIVSKEFFPNIGKMSPDAIDLVVFGGSSGGVSSLYRIISSLPRRLDVPVIIVQHMPGIYTREFSTDLDKISRIKVKEATDKCWLVPGTVYIAPGGFHSVIKNDRGRKQIILHKGPREHKCRPSVDVLLRSAVQEYGGNILSVFLSGGGTDGVLGALSVLEHGGIVLLESRESAKVSDLIQKVKILNSNITEVPAEKMSLEIKNLLKRFPLSRDQFKKPSDFRTASEPERLL